MREGHFVSHYKIHSKLGAGGMGEVYLATDTLLDRKVALKILPNEVIANANRVRRFLQEAKAASSLNHPHIITIHEMGEADSIHFIATEFIDGMTLREAMKRGHLQTGRAIEIAVQVALALAAAHDVKIVHRDIKPENIMLRADGYVKVLDFGLAKLLQTTTDAEASTLVNTADGVVLGTLSYMSPEQARGLEVDARTDIWSLGAVIYEMVAGKPPFEGTTTTAVLAAVLEHEPAPLARYAPDAPADLERLIRKALAKDPDERYHTVKDLLVDLKALSRQLDGHASGSKATRQIPAANKTGRSPGFKRSPIPVVAVAMLVLVSALAFLFRNQLWSKPTPSNEPITLAILPFLPLNDLEDSGFLTTGLPDAIITRLANVHQIRVRPTRAILRYEGQKVSAQTAGRELVCNHVVLGTIQKIGDHLKIHVQLVHASDESTIWGAQFEKDRTDILSLQDAVSAQIAEALRIQMTAAEQARVYRRYTDNVAAYELYLSGRSKLAHYTKDDTLAAIKAFEDALRLDANYALAHAGLAEASALMRIRFAREEEVKGWDQRARDSAHRALELDGNLAEAHEALAAVYRNSEFNWDQTIIESDRALSLNPNLEQPHYYRAGAFYHLGLFDVVEKDVAEGLRINPLNKLDALRLRGITALMAGRYSEAVAFLEEARGVSSAAVADWYLAQAYYYQGAPERAEQILTGLHGSAQAEQRAKATLASFVAARNDKQRATRLLEEVLEGSYQDHHVHYSVGVAYAQLGDRPKARLWLARAIATGFPCYPWFQRDQLLRPLQGDAEYEGMLAELKKAWEAARAKYE